MNWRDDDIEVETQQWMTWQSATKAVLKALGDRDEPLLITAPRPRGAREYLKRLALEAVKYEREGATIRGLPLRNAIDHTLLPRPKPTTLAARNKLKADLLRTPLPDRQPYLIGVTATAGDRWLPCVPGTVTINGIDSEPDDPTVTLSRADLLFDTGAHVSSITDDLIDNKFRTYLKHPIHDPYRSTFGVAVQAAAVFAFGDGPAVEMDCVFRVVPVDSMPNRRSGIILGQNTLIDSIQYTSVPRRVLIARGEDVPDTVWGDIKVNGMVNVDGGYITL